MYSFLEASLLLTCKLSSTHLLWEGFSCCFPGSPPPSPCTLGRDSMPRGWAPLSALFALSSSMFYCPASTLLLGILTIPSVSLFIPLVKQGRGFLSACVPKSQPCTLCSASSAEPPGSLHGAQSPASSELKDQRENTQRPLRDVSKRRCHTTLQRGGFSP